MMYSVMPVESEPDFQNFLKAPLAANQGAPGYFLSSETIIDIITGFVTTSSSESDLCHFVVYEGDTPVGRITAFVNREHDLIQGEGIGFFGFFDCINDEKAARLLISEALDFLKDKGCYEIRGPYNMSFREPFGLLISGFETPPLWMMPHNQPFYADLLEAAGFIKAKDYFCWRFDIERMALELKKHPLPKPPENERYKYAGFGAGEESVAYSCFREVFDTINAADPAFIMMPETPQPYYKKIFNSSIDPSASVAAFKDGKTAALCLALPNFYDKLGPDSNGNMINSLKSAFKRKFGDIESERIVCLGADENADETVYLDLTMAVFSEYAIKAFERGVKWCEVSLMPEDMRLYNDIYRKLGGEIHKIYRIYSSVIAP